MIIKYVCIVLRGIILVIVEWRSVFDILLVMVEWHSVLGIVLRHIFVLYLV